MWNQNLRWKRSQSKRLKHNRPNVSLWNRAAWAQPFAGSQPLLCLITPHPVTKQQGLPCNWTVHPWTLPISNELSVRNLLVLLLLSYWWAPHWAISDDNGQWGTTGEVIQSRVNGAMVIGLLPLGILLFFFLIGNVFLVDGASWISLLNMRVEVSPTILVEETFNTFFALMGNHMEIVYRPWGNRLNIHQFMGSLNSLE
jgi:hypothetical protein